MEALSIFKVILGLGSASKINQKERCPFEMG